MTLYQLLSTCTLRTFSCEKLVKFFYEQKNEAVTNFIRNINVSKAEFSTSILIVDKVDKIKLNFLGKQLFLNLLVFLTVFLFW